MTCDPIVEQIKAIKMLSVPASQPIWLQDCKIIQLIIQHRAADFTRKSHSRKTVKSDRLATVLGPSIVAQKQHEWNIITSKPSHRYKFSAKRLWLTPYSYDQLIRSYVTYRLVINQFIAFYGLTVTIKDLFTSHISNMLQYIATIYYYSYHI